MFCHQQVVQLHHERERIVEAGADLVVIGNGAPNFIAGFRDKSGYTGTLYTDPSRRTHNALQLRRTIRSNLNLKTVRKGVGAYRAGFRQTAVGGDAWQQGGVVIIDTDARVLFRYPSHHAGDHPPVNAIIAALNWSKAKPSIQST